MSQLFDNVCNSFLAEYCPDPKLIRKAIDRSNLWTIEEKRAGDPIALEGEKPETCWLILEGQVEILSGGKHITWRGRGDLIGEQGSLRQLIGKPKEQLLAADIFARGPVQLARVEAAFQSKLSKPARAVWALTLAAVVNKKLEQSIGRHVRALKQMDDRDDLLRRFSEGESLRLVQTAVGENERPVQPRETIVWFSDIANFSTWSKGKRAETTAKLARKLAEIQIDLIRAHGGMIDKLMGDGVMAIWFIDTPFEKTTVPIRSREQNRGHSIGRNGQPRCALRASKAG
jgi:CRP-like cAMP-binding protein